MTYGFAPGVLPSQIPNVPKDGKRGPNMGWLDLQSDTSSFDGVEDVKSIQQTERKVEAIFVPADEQPIYGNLYLVSITIKIRC